MPRIFDNIDLSLLPALRETIDLSQRADFCVGYFNLRGWKKIDEYVEAWSGGPENRCRLLVGMQRLPQDELREALSILKSEESIDNQTALQLKKRLAQEFRDQLMVGVPTNEDEAGLRRLADQVKANKVVVKLFLRHTLHAKLYLLFRPDPIGPIVGYLGSSNLTFAGLEKQGELNIDVVDQDACQKLAKWFEDRWNDRWCLDISKELLEIIEESWARADDIPPYHIYLKIAYHLSQEARKGVAEFKIPKEFGDRLFDFQVAAVKIAAHHLNRRGGVLIGDVVGLGKTLMATALARIFEQDQDLETLIICPKNLVSMWESYREEYRLRGKVVSSSRVIKELPNLRRYRIVLIDESHNLRNREGKRYRAIQDYITKNDSKVVLLTATPYNKTYVDLSNQLRLFIADDEDIGIRPENYLKQIGETEFIRRHQCPLKSIAAFEKSEYADDWRELMRLYLVRRTRTFVKEHYADVDCTTCGAQILATETECGECGAKKSKKAKRYLTFSDGTRSPFPNREPHTVRFSFDESDANDQYATLYSDRIVNAINRLLLPRYGLGNYIDERPHDPPTAAETRIINDLSRAGQRLMGFCRTNLFKRLESSGQAFIQSLERHILRNHVFLHAISNGLDLPIGAQDASLLDTNFSDEEYELFDEGEGERATSCMTQPSLRTEKDFRAQASQVYELYADQYKRRFRWLSSDRFSEDLGKHLKKDSKTLLKILADNGDWNPGNDAKLNKLHELLTKKHWADKVLIFTQFADTVAYLDKHLTARGIEGLAAVTGDTENPTKMAWRFSPVCNGKRTEVSPNDEINVLIATDVLSEGQNLQDCGIVINFDMPWAIIRLIQRAGRVDRIGQMAQQIRCYTFLPADGVERIIRLRSRVRQRLRENAEVVGTDEAFFEDDRDERQIVDLYNEKAGILDGEPETEIDLSSYAYQIWNDAITEDPSLAKEIEGLPDVVYSTKPHEPTSEEPEGALVYARTAEGHDALAWIDRKGNSITESQYTILKAAQCEPETPALPRHANHHQLVKKGIEYIAAEEKQVGGQLGRPSGARFRTYERLKRFAEDVEQAFPLFPIKKLQRAIEDIYSFPLRPLAVDILNRQLRTGISDEDLAHCVVELREEGRLCVVHEEAELQEPQIICSMGLKRAD